MTPRAVSFGSLLSSRRRETLAATGVLCLILYLTELPSWVAIGTLPVFVLLLVFGILLHYMGGPPTGLTRSHTPPTRATAPTIEAPQSDLLAYLRAPELKGSSRIPPSILSFHQLAQIMECLPARCQCMDTWWLLFSSSEHGSSLQTLLYNSKSMNNTLLVITSSSGDIFGVFCPRPIELSGGRYQGSGETFVFTFHPTFRCYAWSRKNDYFCLARHDSLAFGGGRDCALQIDSGLLHGQSGFCETFDSPPLCRDIPGNTAGLSHPFDILSVEVWHIPDVSTPPYRAKGTTASDLLV